MKIDFKHLFGKISKKEVRMVYLGIDLHKRYSYAVAVDETGKVISQKKMLHSKDDWYHYIKYLIEPVNAVIEATINWYFLMGVTLICSIVPTSFSFTKFIPDKNMPIMVTSNTKIPGTIKVM